jgi:hypothetical protein
MIIRKGGYKPIGNPENIIPPGQRPLLSSVKLSRETKNNKNIVDMFRKINISFIMTFLHTYIRILK